MLSQPDLISKTDCDLAVGEKKKSQVNQKSPSAVLPWGYSSPINVVFAKITDNCTIKGGKWRGGESKQEVLALGEKKWQRETSGREEVGEEGAWTTEEKWQMDQLGARRKTD